jgi:DNA repair exonuclease SbcCD ATPase subunit
MTQKTLKEFGLEFITEMANDRKVAQQEIGVVVSGTKSYIVSKGLQHYSYSDIDDLIKKIRKETSLIVDSELTRITIKSLGRIKEAISGSGFILKEGISPEQENDFITLKENILELKNQIKEKTLELKQQEEAKTLTLEQAAENADKIDSLNADIKRLRNQQENQQKELELHQKQTEEIINELQMKQALIDRLKEQEIIHDKDIEEALASIAETYQIQENYYQRMLEEGIQSKIKEIRQEFKIDLEEMTKKLETTQKRSEESQNQQKITVSRLEEELQMIEEELMETKEKLLHAETARGESNLLQDYTSRLLSTHPLYASILILINLGGILDLPTLAMSVGAHPRKLRQMLDELVTKGLITISSDDPPTVSTVMS